MLVSVWFGCADSSSSNDPPIEAGDPDTVPFAPFQGWPGKVSSRQIGTAATTKVLRLAIDSEERTWVLHEDGEYAALDPRAVLERYRANGTREWQIVFPAGTRVPEFVVHPGGGASAFVLTPDEAASSGARSSSTLAIVRISPSGEVSAPAVLRDADGPLRQSYRWAHVVAMADGDGLYLVAWTPGVMLYRVAGDGSITWRAEVMPVNVGMAYFPPREGLARDDRGNLYVAYQIYDEDLAIYNDHFDRPPLTARGSYDVLVQAFDAGGNFVGGRLFGGPDLDAHVGLTVRDGRVIVVGSARLKKYDEASSPNRTMERDLLVTSGRLDGTGGDSYTTIDLSRDDRALAMVEHPDGSLIVVGTTDFVQVDSNSVIEDGKGMIATLTADGQLLRQVTLPGPRDVQIVDAGLLPDGALVFAGIRNGPLTHTDQSQLDNHGMLGIAPP